MGLALSPQDRALVAALNITSYLQVVSVVARTRAAGRLVVAAKVAEVLEDYVVSRGASAFRAPFYCLETASPVRGTHHVGSFVPEAVDGARPIVYFGMSQEFARGAMQADVTSDHEVLGRLFGYPRCCTEAYVSTSSPERLDHLPSTIAGTGPFPAAMNPAIPFVYDLPHLLFHFPCSPDCRESLALLDERERHLARFSDRLPQWSQIGRGIALYGPSVGIALVTEAECLERATYRVVTALAAGESPSPVRAGVTLRIAGPHEFEVDGRPCGGPEAFVAFFE
ncbi:MAG: hypothetical protein WAJ85_03800 [Candidatus Baltobacteraceae bacterium]|jgi:hypothetical protein